MNKLDFDLDPAHLVILAGTFVMPIVICLIGIIVMIGKTGTCKCTCPTCPTRPICSCAREGVLVHRSLGEGGNAAFLGESNRQNAQHRNAQVRQHRALEVRRKGGTPEKELKNQAKRKRRACPAIALATAEASKARTVSFWGSHHARNEVIAAP